MSDNTSEAFVCLFIGIIVGLLALGLIHLKDKSEVIEKQIIEARQEVEYLEYENEQLRARLNELQRQLHTMERLEQWLDKWEMNMTEPTDRMPLNSQPGMERGSP